MLRVVVVDSSAEARNRITRRITEFLSSDIQELALLPPITVQPLSMQEIKFHEAPDVCIIGDHVISQDMAVVASLRKLLPHTPLLVQLTPETESLSTIEHLADAGADDTLSIDTDAITFFKKLVLLARKKKSSKQGQLILVDSGKGGIGVTSVVAGIAEQLTTGGKKVVTIDLDFETQDLSRFLQVRPFVNENLQLLFDGARPVTEEFVEQCVLPVWEEEDGLFCTPPCTDSEDLYDIHANYSRILVSFLEILDQQYDSVVVDVGSARGVFLKTLYRVADKVIFLVNSDPATLYASADRLSRQRGMMAPNAQLLIVENGNAANGLSREVLEREFVATANLADEQWADCAIPFAKSASRWPGSGDTISSINAEQTAKVLNRIIHLLGLREIAPSDMGFRSAGNVSATLKAFTSKILKTKKPKELPAAPAQKLLPGAVAQTEGSARQEITKPVVAIGKIEPDADNGTNGDGAVPKKPEAELDATKLFKGASVS